MSDSKSLKSNLTSAGISLGIVVTAIAAAYGLAKLRPDPARADDTSSVQAVLTAAVEMHTDGITIESDGLVVPFREVDLPAEVAGRIAEKSEICRAGNFVEAGTVLFRLDARDYELEVKRLGQELQQAGEMISELEQELQGNYELLKLAEEEVALKRRELKRVRDLANVVSASDAERAESAELQARNALRQLQNQYAILEARRTRLESAKSLVATQLEKAELDRSRIEIRAPFNGVIVEDLFEQEDYVQKGAVLARIEDTAKVEVQCKLEMTDLYWIWNHQIEEGASANPATPYQLPRAERVEVVYTISGLRDREYTWKGRLDRFDGFGLDERTRTVPCRVVVDNPRREATSGPPALIRGMFVSIRIHVRPDARLVRVPSSALRPGNQVWRVRDGVLDMLDVEFVRMLDSQGSTSADSDNRVALLHVEDPELLRDGDQVVVSPMPFVRSGLKVAATPAAKATPATTRTEDRS